MAERFLDKVYDVATPEENRRVYDAWAASYDAEIAENGYATPARTAALLAAHVADRTAPVLDFGCGTGLSGLALRAEGFTTIDGLDLSPGMLEKARARGLYRRLGPLEPDAPLPVAPGAYAAITAVGVISTGAAPPETLDALLALLPPGGRIAFSFNDHALADPAFEARVAAALKVGTARQLVRDYGPHLPKIGLNSAVYVLEKL